MAVAARQMLIEAAAQQWNVDPSALTAAAGRVINPRNSHSLTYGEITHGKKLTQSISGDPPFTPTSDWKIAGTAMPKA
jgi:isoquinoline 1-oxidoreductase